MNEEFWIGPAIDPNPPKLTRRQRKRQKNRSLTFEGWWEAFLGIAGNCLGNPGMGFFSSNKGLLAYSFEREGFPEGDEFDRMRVRVTGAMPLRFRLKLIEEVKSGKRHMREF